MTPTLPLIDVSPLINGGSGVSACAREIDRACRESGFFRITGHGVSAELRVLMDKLSRKFFDQPEAEKTNSDNSNLASACLCDSEKMHIHLETKTQMPKKSFDSAMKRWRLISTMA